MDYEIDNTETPPDVRISGDRRVEGIVPAPHPSTSSEGLVPVLEVSTANRRAIASDNVGSESRVVSPSPEISPSAILDVYYTPVLDKTESKKENIIQDERNDSSKENWRD